MTAEPLPAAANAEARCFALVPCAGSGTRAGAGAPKQYRQVAGRAVVAWTLDALQRVPALAAIAVVLSPDDTAFEDEVPHFAAAGGIVLRSGGATRAATVANGLAALLERSAAPADWVLVHDAARCLIRPQWVSRLIEACRDDAVGGLLAWPLADTLKLAGAERVSRTVDRAGTWAAQTPQMFRIGLLVQALARAPQVTDEAGAVEALGHAPKLVRGEFENFKLTWPEDFELADRLLRGRAPLAGDEGRA